MIKEIMDHLRTFSPSVLERCLENDISHLVVKITADGNIDKYGIYTHGYMKNERLTASDFKEWQAMTKPTPGGKVLILDLGDIARNVLRAMG